MLRVALVDAGSETRSPVAELASGLRSLGCQTTVVEVTRVPALIERGLRARGFVPSLGRILPTLRKMLAGDHDAVHVFTPVDAQAALAWRRITGRPVIYTCVEPPARETIANRRGQLHITTTAFRDPDAVTAADPLTRVAISRWLALDVAQIGTEDAAAYAELYASCMGERQARG
jgi:hypothetical protein